MKSHVIGFAAKVGLAFPAPARRTVPAVPAVVVRARSGPPPAGAGAEQRFVIALEAYARCDWHLAYGALGALADEGHAHAARLALQIARHGDRLFGGHFHLSEGRRRRWSGVLTGPRFDNELGRGA